MELCCQREQAETDAQRQSHRARNWKENQSSRARAWEAVRKWVEQDKAVMLQNMNSSARIPCTYGWNALQNWGGASKRLEWVKKLGQILSPSKPKDPSCWLLATFCHHRLRDFGCSTKDQDLNAMTFLILSFLLVFQHHSGALGMAHTVIQIVIYSFIHQVLIKLHYVSSIVVIIGDTLLNNRQWNVKLTNSICVFLGKSFHLGTSIYHLRFF